MLRFMLTFLARPDDVGIFQMFADGFVKFLPCSYPAIMPSLNYTLALKWREMCF